MEKEIKEVNNENENPNIQQRALEKDFSSLNLEKKEKSFCNKSKEENEMIEFQLQKILLNSPFSEKREMYLPTLNYLKTLKNMFPFNRENIELQEIVDLLAKNAQNENVLEIVFMLLGGINSKNTEYYNAISNSKKELFHLIDDYKQKRNYESYVLDNFNFIFQEIKFKEFIQITFLLEKLGFSTENKEVDNLLSLIKTQAYKNDKILVIINGNNFSWFKSPNNAIVYSQHDMSVNKHTYIFYNKNFLNEALPKLCSHPRVELGFISSMQEKNLQKIVEDLKKIFVKYNIYSNEESIGSEKNKEILIFHQGFHLEKKTQDLKNPKKPEFYRSLEKIINGTKFNKTNIIILESDDDKVCPESGTKDNTINMPYYVDEKYFSLSNEELEKYRKCDKEIIKLLVSDVLDTCVDDVRENISSINHKLSKIEFLI